ncbi:hypothetical protein ACH4U5_09275 [Streptomyces sp. NPDC020858]|uniref:ATP-dependent DNA ligase n=1 Tax=Streptomyces sp. NPDC020858 TaxID=3365097 RepID=UPI0037A36E28
MVAAAEQQLPHGLVLDGELVVWDTEAGRLSFEALQRRAAARGRGAAGLAGRWPACFIAFDVLQLDGQELLSRPCTERRAFPEQLFTDHALTAPWTLWPMTTDLAKAREWLQTWTDVSGVEGIVGGDTPVHREDNGVRPSPAVSSPEIPVHDPAGVAPAYWNRGQGRQTGALHHHREKAMTRKIRKNCVRLTIAAAAVAVTGGVVLPATTAMAAPTTEVTTVSSEEDPAPVTWGYTPPEEPLDIPEKAPPNPYEEPEAPVTWGYTPPEE